MCNVSMPKGIRDSCKGYGELFLGPIPRSSACELPMIACGVSEELINKNKPLWLRPAEGVTHEEYAELYKFLSADWEDSQD